MSIRSVYRFMLKKRRVMDLEKHEVVDRIIQTFDEFELRHKSQNEKEQLIKNYSDYLRVSEEYKDMLFLYQLGIKRDEQSKVKNAARYCGLEVSPNW